MRRRSLLLPFLLPIIMLAAFPGAASSQTLAYEEAPHHYWTAPLTDAAATLDDELQSGTFKLPDGSDLAAFRSVLQKLNIPECSQVLVFSKTSVQKDRISPWNPRAIYFNDESYAAWVPGGILELTTLDPILGPIFRTLDFHRPDRPAPRLDRPQSCLDCHGNNMTNRVPGLMIRSVFPDKEGSVLFQAGTSLIDHTSPIEKRWGGWFVTGTHGSLVHRGNALAKVSGDAVILDTAQSSNLQELSRFFPAANYPVGTSDIVALMILEHQIMMTSRLVEASYDVRAALIRQADLRRETGEPPTTTPTGTAKIVIDNHAGKILDVLLFQDEAELPQGGLKGGAEFQRAFRAGRPANAAGLSLTDLHLGNRLFRHRCSYLIHSRLWAALPAPLLDILYQRLYTILSSPEPPAGYAYLGREERQAILSILTETLPGRPVTR